MHAAASTYDSGEKRNVLIVSVLLPIGVDLTLLRFKRAAFLQSLKTKIGLAASKAAALRINFNVEGCGIVAAPVHAPSRAPLLLPLLLSHNLPLPRVD